MNRLLVTQSVLLLRHNCQKLQKRNVNKWCHHLSKRHNVFVGSSYKHNKCSSVQFLSTKTVSTVLLNQKQGDHASRRGVTTIQKCSNRDKADVTHNGLKIKKLLVANRGEIATRIMRAGSELGCRTVGLFSATDRFTQHRYKADESYLIGQGAKNLSGQHVASLSPVAAYLDIHGILDIATQNQVDAIHPGYGFLSENVQFAQACQDAGILFVGPTVENLSLFSDKTSARELAISCNVPVVPGTDGPVATHSEAQAFCHDIGYPVIIKASMGGGGRGMRVVLQESELEESFNRASSEALASFGDGTVFIERYVKDPRHIEVQILGDGTGNVVHLFHRDCSVQRRHQKVLECAPATHLSPELETALFADALKITSHAKYLNAGTVEFLLDSEGRHYFIEVNPRIQVEHTITEEITGIDLVQSQIKIASGMSFNALGLQQENINCIGHAMQCRVTTEDPTADFQPDSGTIEVFRSPGGMGIRIDDGPGFVGAKISPHYDSLLVKVTARALDRQDAARKLTRALKEFRVRGVKTNKSFLLNVLAHDEFRNGTVTTSFIAQNPHLLDASTSTNRGQKLLKYIGNVLVNGPEEALGANLTSGENRNVAKPIVPSFSVTDNNASAAVDTSAISKTNNLYDVYKTNGPAAFAKAVRSHSGLLLTDTTWRDAHQSLLATRVRTQDLEKIAPATALALEPSAYSLEMWGGATFDVSMRFLREDPWHRLSSLRDLVPNIPFQMLLRGANAVGYTSYPDNVVFKFCDMAQKHGMDVFRVFDSLNYVENMKLGIDAVGAAGGIIEAAISYTGDISDPTKGMYNLEYYLNLARELKALGIHVLCIKDMAGLLKPNAAKILISALRAEHPDLPIHVHTHDTAGTGVASMLACAYAGADAVDVATDAMSGMTSQPSMGAIVAALAGEKGLETGLNMGQLSEINDYWETTRSMYAPFESGQKSGSSDVYEHEMPGGQYTNLMFQSKQLGLSERWPAIKKAYAVANKLCGDIIKVTPSSKVVGDLAQFIVQNDLTEETLLETAETLSFPSSVVEYFQGYLGIPPFGFPTELREKILKGKTLPNGKHFFDGRPGAEMEAYDFVAAKNALEETYGLNIISDTDVMSHAMYPTVFDEYMTFRNEFGDMKYLDTPTFVSGLIVGEEIELEIEHGKTIYIKLIAISEVNTVTGTRDVIFELNGRQRVMKVEDKMASVTKIQRLKAIGNELGSIGAPMPGVVVEMKVTVGEKVKVGQPLVVLSAMKMETIVAATMDGTIMNVGNIVVGDHMLPGDLLVTIEGKE